MPFLTFLILAVGILLPIVTTMAAGVLTARYLQRRTGSVLLALLLGMVAAVVVLCGMIWGLMSRTWVDCLLISGLVVYVLWMRRCVARQKTAANSAQSNNSQLSKRLAQDQSRGLVRQVEKTAKMKKPVIDAPSLPTSHAKSKTGSQSDKKERLNERITSGAGSVPSADMSHEPATRSTVLYGFPTDHYRVLSAQAAAAGWQVKGVLDSAVDCLVKGPQGGGLMVAKAEALGVRVMDEAVFLQLLAADSVA